MNGSEQMVHGTPRVSSGDATKKGPAVPRVRAWTCPRSSAVPVLVVGFESIIIPSVFGIPRESQAIQTEPAGIPLPRVRATLRVLDRMKGQCWEATRTPNRRPRQACRTRWPSMMCPTHPALPWPQGDKSGLRAGTHFKQSSLESCFQSAKPNHAIRNLR